MKYRDELETNGAVTIDL